MSGGFGTVSVRRIARCTCERVSIADGEWVEWPDPSCREHGRLDEWRSGDPLRCYQRVIDKKTGEALTPQEARERLHAEHPESFDGWATDIGWWLSRFRDETPRETEARLFSEIAA